MKGLDSTQVEQLKEIAEYLYQQRQHQGISLEKIAKQTYIPQRILQALESAQLDILPEPVYIKGFIRRYADALGLDGMMISDAFDVEPASLAHTAPEMQPELAVSASRPALPAESQPEQRAERLIDRSPRPERSPQSGLSFLPWLGAGITALALGAFAFSLLNQPQQSAVTDQAATTAPPTNPSVSSSAPSAASVSPSPAASDVKKATLAEGTPVQVDLNLTDRSWLEVSVDGKVVYEGSLDKGEQRTWKAKKNILVIAGNAGAVVASFNQSEAKALGKAGDVVTVAFPTPEKLPSP